MTDKHLLTAAQLEWKFLVEAGGDHWNFLMGAERTSRKQRQTQERLLEECHSTQTAFRSLIAQPLLSEKLLRRPPNRFLADIVKELQCNYYCFGDTIQPSDLDVTDRASKIALWTKLLEYTQSQLGRQIDVSVEKIVTGGEPEKTNRFMQCWAELAFMAQGSLAP